MGDDYQNKDSVAESSRLGRENDMHDIFRPVADLEKNQRGAELDWTLSGLQGPRSIIDLSWPLQGFSAPLALNPGQQLTCEGQQSSRPPCAQALLGQDTGLEERRREDLKRPMHSAGPSRGCSVVFNLQTHLILFIHVENFKGGLRGASQVWQR